MEGVKKRMLPSKAQVGSKTVGFHQLLRCQQLPVCALPGCSA